MRTVICTFRNEAYLLPFWLRHHRELFDHGVMVDYHSTDGSAEIIRELVPKWELIPSENKTWDVVENDFEIMFHERRFEGWKISLNVTEFLCAANLSDIEKRVKAEGKEGAHARGVIMMDPPTQTLPDPNPNFSLVGQRCHGIYEDLSGWRGRLHKWGIKTPPTYDYGSVHEGPYLVRKKLFSTRLARLMRSRLYHCAPHGAYFPGRHITSISCHCLLPQKDLLLLHYYYSPMNEPMIERASRQGDIASKRMLAEHNIARRFHRKHVAFDLGGHHKKVSSQISKYGLYDMSKDSNFLAATKKWHR